jgi:multidrug efflux pump subunit AcrA (membrane-fusion protein)
VAARAESRVRRFPSILQPADVSLLSFEISGQLRAINLQVGQKVQLGDVLAEIDPRSLQSQVDQASAGVQQVEAQVENAEGDFQRKQELLKRGVTTQAAFDQSKANLTTLKRNLTKRVGSSSWPITTSIAASFSPRSREPSPASRSNHSRRLRLDNRL